MGVDVTARRAATGDPVLDRRSIRKYTDQPVDEVAVRRLLEAAMSAPSAGNQQPWQFVVIRDAEVKRRVPKVHPYAAMLPVAPVAILVCGIPQDLPWDQFWEQDCSAATENILVEAQALGLGAVWLGVHPLQERVDWLRELLGIPSEVVPFALVAVGYPTRTKPPSNRFDEDRVHYDRW
jgi:nitroreductase